ncbi:MAG: hypothetical protein EP333_05525 [Bacteroidetes bacterium]|nr:MAG: hypothetical protein EP333_05525 [Bacteroidota bacterium]
MASKRLLKKRLRRIVEDLLDDCDYLIVNETSTADEADKLIDEAVDFYEEALNEINKAKEKSDYRKVVEMISTKEEQFFSKLNKLNK